MFLGTGNKAFWEVSLKMKEHTNKNRACIFIMEIWVSCFIFLKKVQTSWNYFYFMVCEFLGTHFQAFLHSSDVWQS